MNVVLVVLVTLVVNVVLVVLVRLVVNVLTVAVVLLVRVEVIVLRVVVVFGRDVVTVSVCVEVVLVRVTVVSVVVELTVVVVADIVVVVVVAVTVAVTVVDVVDVPSSRASGSHPCSCKGSTMPRASATQTTGAFIHASCPTDATSQLKDIKATSCRPTQPWAEYGPNFKSRNCNNGISASWCESFNGFPTHSTDFLTLFLK